MGNGNYLNDRRLFPIDDSEGEVVQEKSASPHRMRGPSLGISSDVLKRTIDFSVKFFSSNGAAFKLPIKRSFVFARSSSEKFEPLTGHG
jgi:hypothetical protein